MPNSSSASAAACMTGQSESLPMTTPTTGVDSLIDVSCEVGSRVRGTLAEVVEVVADHGDMADLAAGTHVLAVQVDLQARVARHGVTERAVQVGGVTTEHVRHDGVRC